MIFNNPEFIRNSRSMLRKKGLVTIVALVVIAIIIGTIIIGEYQERRYVAGVGYVEDKTIDWKDVGELMFWVFFVVFMLIFLALNSVFCFMSISSEVTHKTYDFQLMNLMTPFELMIGKLFGSSVFGHYLMLLLLPFITVGGLLKGIAFGNIVLLIIVAYLFGVAINMLALLLSSYIRKGMSIALPIVIVVLFFFTSYFGLIVGNSPYIFISPFETMTALINNEVFELSFFGYIYNATAFNVFFYSFFIVWLGVALIGNLKQTNKIFSTRTFFYFITSIHILVIGLLWFKHPLIFQSAYGLQQQTIMDIAKQYFTFFFVFLFIVYALTNTPLERYSKWLRMVRKEGIFKHFCSRYAPKQHIIFVSALISILVFSVLLGSREWGKGETIIMILYILFIIRETLYFEMMKLHGHRFAISLLYMILFYIVLSFFFLAIKSDLVHSVFPLTGFISFNTAKASYGAIIATLIVQIIILKILYLSKLRWLRKKIFATEPQSTLEQTPQPNTTNQNSIFYQEKNSNQEDKSK